MGSVIDVILLKDLITTPETINTDYISDTIDISFREQEFSIQAIWENGNNVDMNLFLAVSNDGVNFARIPASEQSVTEDASNHLWNVGYEGSVFLRVEIDVIGGSIDLTALTYRAKRKH